MELVIAKRESEETNSILIIGEEIWEDEILWVVSPPPPTFFVLISCVVVLLLYAKDNIVDPFCFTVTTLCPEECVINNCEVKYEELKKFLLKIIVEQN